MLEQHITQTPAPPMLLHATLDAFAVGRSWPSHSQNVVASAILRGQKRDDQAFLSRGLRCQRLSLPFACHLMRHCTPFPHSNQPAMANHSSVRPAFAFLQSCHLDPSRFLSRICFTQSCLVLALNIIQDGLRPSSPSSDI